MEKNINFNVGDTNFIALTNCKKYASFVDEDWDLEMLQTRWLEENAVGNIIVCQMTDEGTEDEWVIGLEGEDFKCAEFLAHETSHITVTEGELCFVEYTCLTMAAQFADEYVLDSYCSSFAFKIENGEYQVDVYKLKNADTGEKVKGERDIIFKFTKVEKADTQGKILWCTGLSRCEMIFHRYLIFHSRWGMVLWTWGAIYEYEEYIASQSELNEDNLYEICPDVYVYFKPYGHQPQLHPLDYPHMVKGLRKVQSYIAQNTKYAKTIIVISRIMYDPFCMQEEAFVVGMMEWAAKAFTFNCPSIETNFDRENNKYVFRFEE